MKIVLDTNVLVSGLLSPFGPPGELVRLVAAGDLTLCFDARLTSEYREVLEREKFGFDRDSVSALLDFVAFAGILVAAAPLKMPLPDPDDEPFLAIALAANVPLVTGNLKHFPLRKRQGGQVLAPHEFLALYRAR